MTRPVAQLQPLFVQSWGVLHGHIDVGSTDGIAVGASFGSETGGMAVIVDSGTATVAGSEASLLGNELWCSGTSDGDGGVGAAVIGPSALTLASVGEALAVAPGSTTTAMRALGVSDGAVAVGGVVVGEVVMGTVVVGAAPSSGSVAIVGAAILRMLGANVTGSAGLVRMPVAGAAPAAATCKLTSRAAIRKRYCICCSTGDEKT